MKKIVLTNKQKIIGICLFSIALILVLLFIFTTVTATENKTTTEKLYSYEYTPLVSYSVFIKDNPIYSEKEQEEDKTYIKNLLDHIKLNVGGVFSCSESSDISITYSLKAVVSATNSNSNAENQSEEKKDLSVGYSKEFVLVPTMTKKITDSKFDVEETINIELDEYVAFANEAKAVTGLSLAPSLHILLEGEILVDTPYSPVTIPIKYGIGLPLSSEVFSITKTGDSTIADNLSTSTEIVVNKPFNKGLIFVAGFVALILVVAIVYFTIFSETPSQQYLLNKKTKRLIKDYNSRIVVLNSFDKDSFSKFYTVNSFNDLIKLADEIEKPIYTEFSANEDEPSSVFFTFDEKALYSYAVTLPPVNCSTEKKSSINSSDKKSKNNLFGLFNKKVNTEEKNVDKKIEKDTEENDT